MSKSITAKYLSLNHHSISLFIEITETITITITETIKKKNEMQIFLRLTYC